MNMNFGRAVIAGLIGTALMTLVGLFAAPIMGLPAMNPAEMLAGAMGSSLILGWGGTPHDRRGLGARLRGGRLRAAGTGCCPRCDILLRSLSDSAARGDAEDGHAHLLGLRCYGDGQLGWPHRIRSGSGRDLRRSNCSASRNCLTVTRVPTETWAPGPKGSSSPEPRSGQTRLANGLPLSAPTRGDNLHPSCLPARLGTM